MKLNAITVSSRCSAAGMALDLAGIDYELKFWPMTELKTPEMLALNPNGKVPVLETPEGPIFETHAILRYVARSSGKLYGSNNYENSQIDQWLDWINSNLQTLAPQFIYQIFGFEGFGLNYEKGSLFKAKASFAQQLQIIENAIGTNNWIVGSEISIADISLVNCIMHYWSFIIGEKDRKKFPNLTNWMNNVAQTDAFIKWWGRVRALPKNLNWPFYAQPANKAAPAKKQKKKQNNQPKKAAPKKKKGPSFPETSFNLMSFKTEFINNKDIPAALEKFWNDFDSNGWCIYHLKYILYKNENEKLFKFNNLMKGFLRGLESIGKFMFGVHGIFGDEPALDCQGVWMMRGTDVLPQLKESGSFDTYEWVKLDHTKPEDRALVEKFWSLRNEDEDSIEGTGTMRTFKWIK